MMSRQFVAQRRQQRGFGVIPWATHNRFIVSHPLIRRAEYRDSLLAHLQGRAEKGLLIVDEAHVAAPASASKYAVDSDTTRAIRDLAPKFDNRLFLSATPHNGHSNSFSALLEILDPIRFTRAVAIQGPEVLQPVMVRRLKRDLRQLSVARFPCRVLTRIQLEHDASGWSATTERYDAETGKREAAVELASALGGDAFDLELSEKLARYTELCAPPKGHGRLPFINLQKRLLSSPEAFARTLEVHAQSLAKTGGVTVHVRTAQPDLFNDPEAYGVDDDVTDAEEDAEVAEASAGLRAPVAEAVALLKSLRAIAERARRVPDGKTRALLAWLRSACCPAIGPAGEASKTERAWTERRVIVFTEYGDTKRYLLEVLQEALAGTDRADERVLVFHGGMGDDARDAVQRAFNAPPTQHPVRILIATDAAREGINLQAHCADLFHFDVPWNPSRLEQRNGRIDRTLQPADEVRCHYFVYAGRREDRVLDTLVRKIETVQRELGSVGAVLLNDLERALDSGIDDKSAAKVESVGTDSKAQVAEQELESQRKQLDLLEAEIHRAAQRLERSKKALEVDAEALHGVVDIGLALSGASPMARAPDAAGKVPAYTLPELDRSWQATLDVLRPPRGRDESFWEWRRRPPRPVTFEPLPGLSDEAEQLHLSHPLVRRILDRFLAQGFSAHDLSRVCGVLVPGESVARVLAYARLTLFGAAAARLHDELITVVAPWPESPEALAPYKDAATAAKAREVTERALALGQKSLPARPAERGLALAPQFFALLWPHLEAEADARATEAKTGLSRRARKESDELRALIEKQRGSIRETANRIRQTNLFDIGDKEQRRQVELDLKHLDDRAARIDAELDAEPRAIEALYDVRESDPELCRRAKDLRRQQTGGLRCTVCHFDFEQRYGHLGRDYAEVHHAVPISAYETEGGTTRVTDLVVVCANCHRMLHRKRPWLAVTQLQQLLPRA